MHISWDVSYVVTNMNDFTSLSMNGGMEPLIFRYIIFHFIISGIWFNDFICVIEMIVF